MTFLRGITFDRFCRIGWLLVAAALIRAISGEHAVTLHLGSSDTALDKLLGRDTAIGIEISGKVELER